MKNDDPRPPFLLAVIVLSIFVIAGFFLVHSYPSPGRRSDAPVKATPATEVQLKAEDNELISDKDFLPVPAAYLPELGDLAPLARIWPRLPKPNPGDWLASFHEEPQTVADMLGKAPARAQDRTLGIAIQPIAPIDKRTRDAVKRLVRFLEFSYQCSVKESPVVGAPRDAYFRGGKQIDAKALLDLLESIRPADTWGLAGITSFDLGVKDMNFVFGLSTPDTGMSVSSNARKNSSDDAVFLRRLMSTVVHELGHALGLSHCIAFSCIMNGSNHLAESDSRPTMFCPHCLAKLRALRGIDPARQLKDLAEFYRVYGIKEDLALAEQSAAILSQGQSQAAPGPENRK